MKTNNILSTLTAVLLVTFLSQQTYSAELFPFDPPSNKQSCKRRPIELSYLTEEKIEQVVTQANKLNAKDRKAFIEKFNRKLQFAIIRDATKGTLSAEALYYANMLSQVDK